MRYSILALIVVALAAVAPTQDASADLVQTTFQCRGGAKVVVTVTCEPGGTVLANYRCGGTEILQKSVTCPRRLVVALPRVAPSPSRFLAADWDVGVRLFGVDAGNLGPEGLGFEALLGIYPEMGAEWVRLFAEVGAGGFFGTLPRSAAISEGMGIQFRPLGWFWVSLAARHRIGFLPDGDRLNLLGGEVGISFLFGGWEFSVSGTAGRAWFPVEIQEPQLLIPAGFPQPDPIGTEVGDDFGLSAGIKVSKHFD